MGLNVNGIGTADLIIVVGFDGYNPQIMSSGIVKKIDFNNKISDGFIFCTAEGTKPNLYCRRFNSTSANWLFASTGRNINEHTTADNIAIPQKIFKIN